MAVLHLSFEDVACLFATPSIKIKRSTNPKLFTKATWEPECRSFAIPTIVLILMHCWSEKENDNKDTFALLKWCITKRKLKLFHFRCHINTLVKWRCGGRIWYSSKHPINISLNILYRSILTYNHAEADHHRPRPIPLPTATPRLCALKTSEADLRRQRLAETGTEKGIHKPLWRQLFAVGKDCIFCWNHWLSLG